MDPFTIISFVALVLGGGLYVFSRIPKQTIANYKEYSESLEKRLGDLEASDTKKGKQIASLISKVEVLQTIPLGDIAKAIKEIVHTQKEIIKIINKDK